MDGFQNIFDNAETTVNTVAVSWVRDSAKHYLKSVIDQEAENWDDVNPQTWKIATYNIVKQLRDSKQMGFLISNIRKRLNVYSGNMCLMIENRSEPVPVYSVKHKSKLLGINNWNKPEVDVVRPKHHHQLAEDISPQQPLNIRLKAFKILLNSQLADIASCDYWDILQKHLVESLCDSDAEIFQCSLKIHSKLLTLSYNIVREGFASLVEGLRSHYSRKFYKLLPVIGQGLEFDKSVHIHIIQISHLILKTTQLLPDYWVRMGDKSVEEIVQTFLSLISMHMYDRVNSKTLLFPFHVMATIDPEAKWCWRWLFCGFGRKVFMSQQSKVVLILRYVVEEIAEYLRTTHELLPMKPVNIICKETVKWSVFSHCVNILCCVASHKKAHLFFPLPCKIKDNPISLPEVLCMLVYHMNNNKKLNYFNFKIICKAMITLVQMKDCPLLSLTEIFIVGLQPMKDVIDQKRNLSCHRVPFHVIKILEALSSQEAGVIFLVEGKCNVEYEKKPPWAKPNDSNLTTNFHPVNTILNYTNFLLCRKRRDISERALILLLNVCTMFFKYYDLCSSLSQIPLIDSAANCFQVLQSQIKDKFHSMTGNVSLKSEELCRSIVNFLANVMSQPSGLLAVAKHSLLISDIIPFVIENSFDLWKSSQFRRTVSMLTELPEVKNVMKVVCSKPLSKVLSDLWIALEDEESFTRGIERKINSAIKQYLNVAYAFNCTLLGTQIFFSEYEGSEETLMEYSGYPVSPSELMMIEHCNEPWHKIALLTVQALTRNLDSWLYVESKFSIEKRLLQVQMENISSPIIESTPPSENEITKKVIIDECSLLLHRILTTSHIVNIPKEEYLLGFNIEILESFISSNYPPKRTNVIKYISDDVGRTEWQRMIEDSNIITNGANWIVNLREAFQTKQEDVKPCHIIILVKLLSQNNGNESIFNRDKETSDSNCKLCDEEILGVKISVRFGVYIGLLDKDLSNDQLLRNLLLHSHAVLETGKNASNFKGFDWFLSSVFLLCAGNLEDCQSFLNHFVTLQVSLVLWPSLAESKHICDLSIMFSSLVDVVITASVPLATAALRATGVPWGTVCYSWLTQCFWTILEWKQVCEWLTFCILYPPDITVYYCAALLNYLQPRILCAAINEFTWNELVQEHFIFFSITEQMAFIDKLIKEHRPSILPKLLEAITIC